MSLYDRDFMNTNSRRGGYAYGHGGIMEFFENNAAVKILIIVNIACFFLGGFVDRIVGYGTFFEHFGLSIEALKSGYIWTFFTYSFLHANLFHIFANMLGLYFLGASLENNIGTKRFLLVYFAGGLIGALLWLGLSFSGAELLVGASACVTSVFACLCALYPPMRLTFLIFFVLPVSLKPMTMLKIAVAFEIFGLLYSWSFGGATVAYSAHLGGMLAGFLFALKWKGFDFFSILENFSFKNLKSRGLASRNSEQKSASDYKYSVNIGEANNLKSEIDRILDKINTEGFASLTESERETLRRAREIFK